MPFYFDLSNGGFDADPAARSFVVAARPELGGNSVPTPPVLMMDGHGQVYGEVDNYAAPNTVLASLHSTLVANPQFDVAMPDELTEQDPIATAQIQIDLQDYVGAGQTLLDVEGNMANYLRARIYRFQNMFDQMDWELDQIDHPDLVWQVHMERAYRMWFEGRYAELGQWLAGFPAESDRHSEARYFEGLALYHQGMAQQATTVWGDTITHYVAFSMDTPWTYRTDWAYYDVTGQTLLGRVNGYLRNTNPDLDGPQSW